MSPHPSRRALARALTGAFLAGSWDYEALIARAADSLEPTPPWLPHLARAVLADHPRAPREEPRVLVRMIELELRSRRYRLAPWPRVHRWLGAYTEMAFRRWPVPVLDDVGALGELLDIDQSQLAWMADVKGLERTARDERLRHYRYIALSRVGGPMRVIEAPKPRLKAIQRRLLHELLDWIPAHSAAHGFTRGRSALSHAAVHSASHAILRIDLEDFFASVPAGRVYAIFRSAGYPEAVAHTLTGLTTNIVSRSAWHAVPRPTDRALIAPHHRLVRRLAGAHLPQGAPTSPALANLAAFGLDRRLAALAESLELRYTRYADDIVFSGGRGLRSRAAGMRSLVAQIARDEGFRVNPAKPRCSPNRSASRCAASSSTTTPRSPERNTTCCGRSCTAARAMDQPHHPARPPRTSARTSWDASPGSSNSGVPAPRACARSSPESTGPRRRRPRARVSPRPDARAPLLVVPTRHLGDTVRRAMLGVCSSASPSRPGRLWCSRRRKRGHWCTTTSVPSTSCSGCCGSSTASQLGSCRTSTSRSSASAAMSPGSSARARRSPPVRSPSHREPRRCSSWRCVRP
jgi:hypothetical protein